MAFENLIQLSFTAEELKKIDDSLAEIEKVLKGKTHNLTSEERKQYGSIAEQKASWNRWRIPKNYWILITTKPH